MWVNNKVLWDVPLHVTLSWLLWWNNLTKLCPLKRIFIHYLCILPLDSFTGWTWAIPGENLSKLIWTILNFYHTVVPLKIEGSDISAFQTSKFKWGEFLLRAWGGFLFSFSTHFHILCFKSSPYNNLKCKKTWMHDNMIFTGSVQCIYTLLSRVI